jgi:ATP-dependent RNA helicase TDRD9
MYPDASASSSVLIEAAPTHTDMDAVSTVLPEGIPQEDINIEALKEARAHQQTDYKKLPIEDHKTDILKNLKMPSCNVLVIEGPTGCGKTTMVPQFIMDDYLDRNDQSFNIIVTQPRRIAAISVAQRVCSQRGTTLGGIIGYQIGMDRTKVTDQTRICFVTTGVLLQILINKKDLSRYSHIIIDEIHERGVDTDFVLMVIRKLMWANPCKTKIILMSATFDVQKLTDYFTLKSNNPEVPSNIPVLVRVAQKPARILPFFLDTMRDIERPNFKDFDDNNPYLNPKMYDVACNIIKNLPMSEPQDDRLDRGAVLVFLPGINEINEMFQHLVVGHQLHQTQKLVILPLHSSINVEEQKKVFLPVKRTERKVILATNIAESSITVPGVDNVIDFCLTKNMIVDRETNLPSLKLEWATKANCKQREGRTGRTRDGKVYRLVPRLFYERFREYPEPEITRTTLETCVLRTKVFNMGAPKRLLALCLDPPKLEDITKAVLKLKRIGALTVKVDDAENDNLISKYDEEDGHLTTLGTAMSTLPIDVNLSKLVVIGWTFGLLEDAIIMASCLSVDSLFSKPHGQDLNAYKSKLAWADRSMCDLFAARNAFLMYQQHNIRTRGKPREMEEWAKTNFIQLKQAREIEELSKEIMRRLQTRAFNVDSAPNIVIPPDEKELLLKVMIAAAFYPYYFLRSPVIEETAQRELPSHNPLNSVIIRGLPRGEGVLYAKQIREFMKLCSDKCIIDFEESRAVVSFVSDENILNEVTRKHHDTSSSEVKSNDFSKKLRDTSVKNSVYIACKLRQAGHPLVINLLPKEEAEKRMQILTRMRDEKLAANHMLRSNRFIVDVFDKRPAIIPPNNVMSQSQLRVKISYIVECGHFFVQSESIETESHLNAIREAIENYQALRLKHPILGMSVLANVDVQNPLNPHDELKQWHRGILIGSSETGISKVRLVDHGLTAVVSFKDILVLDPESAYDQAPVLLSPAQAFECQLMEIKPSQHRNLYETWSEASNQAFKDKLDQYQYFEIEIYSIVDGVARVKLFAYTSDLQTAEKFNINEELIEAGIADLCEESLVSQQNNRLRQTRGHDNSPLVLDVDVFGVNVSNLPTTVSTRHTKELQAPRSPLEVSFVSRIKLNLGQAIRIDRGSVNCVTLEPDLKNTIDRLLVASSITISSDGRQQVVARQTSMMPYLPGFTSLMCLLFSPFAELRALDNKLYIGALCGLGADDNNISYDPDYDIDISFDAVITTKDLQEINVVRFFISSFLIDHQNATIDSKVMRDEAVIPKQDYIRKCLLRLLKRRRMNIPKFGGMNWPSFKWGLLDKSKVVSAPFPEPINTAFRFMGANRDMADFLDQAKTELFILEQIDQDPSIMRGELRCPVDGVLLYTVSALKMHIKDKYHLEACKMLNRQKKDESDVIDEDRPQSSICTGSVCIEAESSLYYGGDDETMSMVSTVTFMEAE